MYRIELFECRTTPIQLHLKAASAIRLNTGMLWLTVEGQCEDVWLRAGEQWDAPRDVKVWLSAESVAHFGLLHAGEKKATLRWLYKSPPEGTSLDASRVALLVGLGSKT